MLIPLLLEHPQALGPVLRSTPTWVWALLAALVALGVSQMRSREMSLLRVTLLPLALVAFGFWGLTSAFSNAPGFTFAVIAWAAALVATFTSVGALNAPARTEYDSERRSFFIPGSWVPLVLMLAIFLTRYVVNVDIAMNPALLRDGTYVLTVAAVYGLTGGIFLGRAARLWRLAFAGRGLPLLLQRDPW